MIFGNNQYEIYACDDPTKLVGQQVSMLVEGNASNYKDLLLCIQNAW